MEMTELNVDRIENLKKVASECRRELPKGTAAVCMDDRLSHTFTESIPEHLKDILITEEKDSGPQFPGGSAGILVVLAETAPEDKDLSFDELYEFTELAHEAADFKMAVHMDNHHDEIPDQEIFEMIDSTLSNPENTELPGCGYAGMLAAEGNPLGLNDRSYAFFNKIKLVPMMVAKGSKLVELEGHHSDPEKEGSLAISNMMPGTTLDHDKLKEKGVKIYGHDPLVADEILLKAADILEERGETNWANSVRREGSRVERNHHRIAAIKLTGSEPIEI
jgi:hypothetical protein